MAGEQVRGKKAKIIPHPKYPVLVSLTALASPFLEINGVLLPQNVAIVPHRRSLSKTRQNISFPRHQSPCSRLCLLDSLHNLPQIERRMTTTNGWSSTDRLALLRCTLHERLPVYRSHRSTPSVPHIRDTRLSKLLPGCLALRFLPSFSSQSSGPRDSQHAIQRRDSRHSFLLHYLFLSASPSFCCLVFFFPQAWCSYSCRTHTSLLTVLDPRSIITQQPWAPTTPFRLLRQCRLPMASKAPPASRLLCFQQGQTSSSSWLISWPRLP